MIAKNQARRAQQDRISAYIDEKENTSVPVVNSLDKKSNISPSKTYQKSILENHGQVQKSSDILDQPDIEIKEKVTKSVPKSTGKSQL